MTETCLLRTDPAAALGAPIAERFELVESLLETSHHWRVVFACRCCGDLYLQEFYEEIDWKDGCDPCWVTYRPVASVAEARACPREPLALRKPPFLCKDRPKGGALPVVRVTA